MVSLTRRLTLFLYGMVYCASSVLAQYTITISEQWQLEKPFPFDPFGQTGFAHLGHNKIDPIES